MCSHFRGESRYQADVERRGMMKVSLSALLCAASTACGQPFFNPRPSPSPLDQKAPPSSVRAIHEIRVDHLCGMIRCPNYEYTLRRDGRAIYEGRDRVAMMGQYVGMIDSATFQ